MGYLLNTPERKQKHYAHTKKWAAANRDKTRAIQKRYRDTHKAELLAKALARIKADPARHRDYQKQWRALNRERSREIVRRSDMKTRWGLTPVAYEALLAAQDGRCAICLEPPTRWRLAVDHDHATGRRRALLCRQCNTMLGKARDSVAVLTRAIAYVLNYQTVPVAS